MTDDRVFGVRCPELGPGLHDMVPHARLEVEHKRGDELAEAVERWYRASRPERESDDAHGAIGIALRQYRGG